MTHLPTLGAAAVATPVLSVAPSALEFAGRRMIWGRRRSSAIIVDRRIARINSPNRLIRSTILAARTVIGTSSYHGRIRRERADTKKKNESRMPKHPRLVDVSQICLTEPEQAAERPEVGKRTGRRHGDAVFAKGPAHPP